VKLFIPFRDAPIRHKLMLIGLLTTALALFSVSTILVARDWVNWRDKTLSEMNIYAALIGANAAPSMIFGDYDAATEVLRTLKGNPNIVDAVLYDKAGKVFVRYRVQGHPDSAFPNLGAGSSLFDFGQMVVSKPVTLKGEVWGSVYLESDLHGLYADIKRHTLLTFIAAAGVFMVALFLFSRLQRTIVDPITSLSDVMRRVSAQQDYAVRVPVLGKDEVGVLADAFNNMLAQIQARDEALERHRAQLEEEVAQRTVELRENNRLLEHELVERKRAEETMARLRHELAMILESAGEGICTMDMKGSHVLVNPSAARMFGYEAEEMVGRDSHSLWHYAKADGSPYPEDESPVYATTRDGVVRRSEGEVFWRKGGDSFPVEYVCTPIRSNGTITGAVVVFRDITERRRAEAERRRLSEAVEQSLEAIVLTDTARSIIYVNPAFTRLFGYPDQDVIGQSVELLAVEAGYGPTPRQAMEVALAQGAYSGETSCRGKGGNSVPVLLNVAAVRDEHNEISGYVGTMTDLTELKRAEMEARQRMVELTHANAELRELNAKLAQVQTQLMQSEKMASIGMLAAGVAHEINNPIGYIRSNLGALGNYIGNFLDLLDACERAEHSVPERSGVFAELEVLKGKVDFAYIRKDVAALLHESREGVERVTKIVQDLKDFSRIETEEQWTPENIHNGIDSTLNVIWNELKYKCEVVKEYGELPDIDCLPSQLNQVFMNLLVNAAQSIETRGRITIRSGREGERVWVEVGDTGQGIPPENIPHLFDPFFTTKPVGKGTGLGLSVSYNIVEKHHGKIEVHSEVGKGTTFRVWLPIRQTKESA
jgi:PAS domain S-box-containing protein